MKRLLDNLLLRRAKRLIQFVLPNLPAIGPILDLGSGTGHNANFLANMTQVEIVEADVADIHSVGNGPVLFDGTVLPFPDKHFTGTMLLFVLHYSHDPSALLKEASRVTSGRVIVLQSTYSGTIGRGLLSTRDFLTGRFAFSLVRTLGLISSTKCALRPKQYFTRQTLEAVFEESGCRTQAVYQFDSIPSCLHRDLYVLEPTSPCP